MVEKLVGFFISIFAGLIEMPLGKEIIVFVISLMPILELRGGLLAASFLGLNPVRSYIISVVGNIIPVPFILWFVTSIIDFMRRRKHLSKIANWLDRKVEKHRGQIERFGFWGLILFVGIPLPGTGAWTGCLVAAVLEMNRKKAFLAAIIGILIASIIMMLVSFGFLKFIIS